MMRWTALFLSLGCISVVAFADGVLLQRADVKKALAFIEASHQKTLDMQVMIAEIPAPTFHESERAKFMAGEFRKVGLKNVEIDKQGNVLGWRDGVVLDTLVLAAHLDIAFEPGVSTKVRKDGARWYGPGLADDSRGLAELLVITEAMNDAGIKTHQTILFVANVGEEGKRRSQRRALPLWRESLPCSVTGVYFHQWLSSGEDYYGRYGCQALLGDVAWAGRAQLRQFRTAKRDSCGCPYHRPCFEYRGAEKPENFLQCGPFSGRTFVNAIAEECSFEVDLRSEDPGQLDKIEVKLLEAVRRGTEEENASRAESKTSLKAETKLIGNRPAGTTPETSPLVQAAKWAAVATGNEPKIAFSSTDSNLPISLGIPAVTLPRGGNSGNGHSRSEFYEPADAWKGPQAVLLTILDFEARRSLRQ